MFKGYALFRLLLKMRKPSGGEAAADQSRLPGQFRLLRRIRGENRWSVAMIAMIAPLSLLAMWLWSTSPDAPPMSHGARPAGLGLAAWLTVFLVAWMLMSAAMMLPSAVPLLVTLDRVSR